MVGCYCFY